MHFTGLDGDENMQHILRRISQRSIVTALGAVALGLAGFGSALADGIPAPPVPQTYPPPPPVYRPAPPVVQEYVAPPPVVVYAYPPPPPVVTYVPPPPPEVVVVPRPYYWGGYRPIFRAPVAGPYFARGYGRFERPWGAGFRRW
jgi:hypothetical protein